VFFTLGWAFATHINKPLTWWRKVLPEGIRRVIASMWHWTLAASSLLFFFALETGIFGFVPGLADADQKLGILFASLGIGLGLLIFTFVAGLAYDIQQTEPHLSPTARRLA
jgi:hypothetical protein